jgi:drug/metabolite transporter (DMT)-like permease
VFVTRRSRLNVSWTIIQFSVVVPFLASLLIYHEQVTLRGVAGVAAIFAAIVLFGCGHSSSSSTLEESDRWIIVLLVLSTFFSGVSNTMSKVYTAMDSAAQPFPMMLVANVTVVALSLAVAAFRLIPARARRARITTPAAGSQAAAPAPAWTMSWTGIAVASWMAVMQLAGTALLIVALADLPGTVAYPVRVVMNIIGVLFFSRVLFDERLKRVEWAGAAVALAGVALVASSA